MYFDGYAIFLLICCKFHLDLDAQLLYSEIELCVAYMRGKVNVLSGECCSHLRPFKFQFITNAAGFRKMYHEASSFCRYRQHFLGNITVPPEHAD